MRGIEVPERTVRLFFPVATVASVPMAASVATVAAVLLAAGSWCGLVVVVVVDLVILAVEHRRIER